MSKFATKAAANMFCQARYEAAKSNERLSSREGAAEEIGIDRTRLARIELGSTIPYQEEVLLIIIGAETGHRKEKVIPEFEWIKRIVVEADYNGIPVFMKDSLIPIVGEKNMRRDYPKELQIRKRSEKVNKKLSGNCMLCGKTEDKNKMVTLTARAVRGGKATSFGHMCHSCFAKWLTSHNIPVPDLENKKEIEDGKEKL